MNQKIILSISFVAFALLNIVTAQPPTNEYATIMPPSAEAAALGKYLDTPSTNHTGAISIPIALYEATSNKIKLPISLSYHAGGIRVEELSTWVGTGWTLSAAGLVSRTIKGIPDEGAGGYLNTAAQLDINDVPCYTDVINRVKDSESDVYSFNAPGIGGKFFFDENGDAQLVPRQDVKIVPEIVSNQFRSFTVIDPRGKKYIFGIHNGIAAYGSSNMNDVFPQYQRTEWFLKRIESFDGSSFIDFDYVREEYSTKVTPHRYTFEASANGTSSYLLSDIQNVDTWRLQKITTQSEIIDFIANTNRDDLSSSLPNKAKGLDAIKITAGGYVMQWEFNYDYFASASSGTLDPEDKRLRLTSIQKKAFDNSTSEPAYQFDYKKLGNDYYLPNRISKSRDYWGFYNGKMNDAYNLNIPSLTVGGYSCGTLCGADRSADSTMMDIGLLTEITYPTGGTMTLEYQANRFKPVMGCPVPPILSTTTQFTGIQQSSCTNPFGVDDCCGINSEDLIVNFDNINDIIFGHAEILAMKDLGDATGGCDLPINAEAKLVILDQSNTVISTTLLSLNDDIAAAQSDPNYPNVVVMDEVNLPFNTLNLLPDQDYTFRISSENAFGRVRIMETIAIPDAPNDEFIVGGLRIKTITKDKGDNTDNIVTQYSYGQGSLLEAYPQFTSFVSDLFQCTVPLSICSPGESDQYVTGGYFYENSIVPLSDLSGEHVGYEEVTVRTGTSNGITKKKYNIEFNTEPYYISANASNYPGNQPSINLAENGLLLESSLFPEGSTLAVASTVDAYNLNDTYNTFGTGSWATTVLSTSNGLKAVFVYPYEHRSKPILRLSSSGTLDNVTTVRSYTYDPMDRFVAPVTEEMTNSDGNVYSSEFTYPHDAAGTVYSTMVDQNRIMPVETRIYENTTQIDGIRTNYSFIDGSGNPTASITNNGPYPASFDRYELTWPLFGPPAAGSWVHQLYIDKYDNTVRRPTEITQDGWQKQFYGYNGAGLLVSQTFQNYTTNYAYFGNSPLLSSVTNIDGTSMSYTHDQMLRLKTTTDNDRNVVTTYDYLFGNPTIGGNKIVQSIDYPLLANSALDLIENISFFDGLGRTMQINKKKQGPTANEDAVTSITYDEVGRVQYELEAISSIGNGAFVPINTGLPKTTYSYYDDPLNRSFQITDPEQFITEYEYGSNTGSQLGGYSADVLNVTTIIDADLKYAQSFQDKKRRTVGSITGAQGSPNTLKTIYEFDGKDRVSKITPPGATGIPDLTYTYEYYANDLVKQKIFPDQANIEYRYNDRDLMTAYQDGNLRDDSQWVGYNYDVYGRQTKMGFVAAPSTNNSATGPTINAIDILLEHTYSTATTGILTGKMVTEKCQPLDFNGLTGIFLTKNYAYEASTGRLENIKSNTLLNSTIDNEIITFTYDAADNITNETFNNIVAGVPLSVVQRRTFDFAGRSEYVFHNFDGDGEEQISKQEYTIKDQIKRLDLGSGLQQIDYTYLDNQWLDKINDVLPSGADLFHLDLLYDESISGITGPNTKNGNISNLIHQVKGKDRMAAGFTYDSFNRLTASRTGYLDAGSTVYDIDQFNTNYIYDDRGNITALDRQGLVIQDDTYVDDMINNMAYSYYSGTNKVQKINEIASSITDDEGNQNAAPDFFLYDANGNMTRHQLKKLNIDYNFINLPSRADYNNGDKIEWIYTPQGEKLKQVVTRNNEIEESRYYCSGNEYIDNTLVQVNHDHGRVSRAVDCQQIQYVSGIHSDNDAISGKVIISDAHIPEDVFVEYHAPEKVIVPETFSLGNNGELYIDTDCVDGAWQYEYVIRDHLGSTRLLFADEDGNGSIDEATEILEENHYYPFGMEMEGEWKMRRKFDFGYTYNGKEFLDDLGVNWHYYGFRVYDPAIGRFTSVDPIAEQYAFVSTFNYAENKPINHIDLHGLQGFWVPGGIQGRLEDTNNDGKVESKERSAAVKVAIGVAVSGGGIIGIARYGLKATATFVVNEVKDEALSQVTGGASNLLDATKLLKNGAEKLMKNSSKYEDVTKTRRGEPSVTNKQTDVSKSEFEGNLENAGFDKSVSKDGKVSSFSKNGSSYNTRTVGNNGATAEFRKNSSSKKPDLKIRLKEEN